MAISSFKSALEVDDKFQIAAENGADFGKHQFIVIFKLFCFFGQVPVFGRHVQGRVGKTAFFTGSALTPCMTAS